MKTLANSNITQVVLFGHLPAHPFDQVNSKGDVGC